IGVLYWYLTRNFNYWSKRGVKGPKPWPIVGNILQLFTTPQPLQELNWAKRYGKIYGIYLKEEPMLTVADPELIKTILVKDFHLFPERANISQSHDKIMSRNLVQLTGDDWKRVRSIVSPTFTSGKMKRMYPRIQECLSQLITVLDTMATDGQSMNAKDLFGRYTMDVIATCAFATKTCADYTRDNPFVLMAKSAFTVRPLKTALTLSCPVFLLKLMAKLRPAPSSGAGFFFMDSTRRLIHERQKSGHKSNDFLQLLCESEKDSEEDIKDELDVNESHHINEGSEELAVERKTLSINVVNKRLTEDEILAQALVFFLAGFETTATTLTFLTYELAINPHIQDSLYAEICAAVDANGDISYEELARLPYLDSVLSETLRLHPPSLRLHRVAAADYKLGDTGLTLYKGQTVQIGVYAVHTREEYYPDPFRFDPDRFMPENRHKLVPYTYVPFGAGPRNCIGMRFALLEAKIAVAHVMRRFRFTRVPQTAVPLGFKRGFRISVPDDVVVGVERRD
ncbi:unnamed protein product, partial [Medioppia subpectinata]